LLMSYASFFSNLISIVKALRLQWTTTHTLLRGNRAGGPARFRQTCV
jgi:hypothetical protein